MVPALPRERDDLYLENLHLQVELDRMKKWYYGQRADRLQSEGDLAQLLLSFAEAMERKPVNPAFFITNPKTNGSFGMQNSCYIQLKGAADWRQRSSNKEGDQNCYCSRIAGGIQTADTVKHAAQYLRKACVDGHTDDQADQNWPGKSAHYGVKYLNATGPERESNGDFFGALRHGVADQAKKAYDCEEDGNAAKQADHGRELFCLENVLTEPGCERGDSWMESGIDATSNRLEGRRESPGIAGRSHQNRHIGNIVGRGRIVNLGRIRVVEFHGARIAHNPDHDAVAFFPLFSDWVFAWPALARQGLAEDDCILFAVTE